MDCSRSLEVLAKMGVLVLVLMFALFRKSSATVVVIGNNISLAFDDIEANFAPAVKGSGACGILQVAEPVDACTPFTKEAVNGKGIYSPFALIVRGSCTFEKKVRNAQKAGFAAAIIYNNDDSSDLVSMAGNADGIHIYAVFVSKAAGEMLASFVGMPSMEFWIIPSYENTAWSAMAIAFISLLAVCAVLATCFFVRRHRLRHVRRRGRHVREFHGMSGRLVKALPSMVFSSVVDEKGTSETCAICLEDYVVGDKLRVLPCQHNFHLACIDSWLTNWRTFCPVCKRDARTSTGEPPASESTPLLSPVSSSAMSAPISSLMQSESRQSSFTGSPAMYIPNSHATSSYVISYSGPSRGGASSYFPPSASSSCLSPVSSRNSMNICSSSALYHHQSERTLNLPSPSPFTRHSLESHTINISPPMSSPSFTSRYMSSYLPGSCSASPQVSILNGRPPRIPSYSASAMPSFAGSVSGASPFASTRSLPGVS